MLAVQSLSIADVNKPMLRPALKLMPRVLQLTAGDDYRWHDDIELALRFMLEMSFDPDSMTELMGTAELKDLLNPLADSDADPRVRKTAASLLFRFDEEARRAKEEKEGAAQAPSGGGGGGKHIMISYSWAQQPLVLECVKAVQAAGVPVWVDVVNMEGASGGWARRAQH